VFCKILRILPVRKVTINNCASLRESAPGQQQQNKGGLIMRCQHCGGNIIVDQCLQCARMLPSTISPVRVTKITKEKKRNQGVQGVCRCCGHTKRIWSDKLCSSCISYVNGHYGRYYPAGSYEREAVLKRVAEMKTDKSKKSMKMFRREGV
jgi:hypothetical protein